ncbi:PTS lactose/cellobiose transporter subunit IIA [Salipaludibacillus agaradhaerens]|jgi:PTS system cellobiose-specific IIA component|uniref:PTS lactose/cellobiose transporter subunit IIA n=1 Tax=Salipaludibacillus agaradhaerens TaxID=76935 RepID=A0A9Q4B4R4_SALAG|nr:PTS lactose/cellobiose transporter subunit IIA [Salipaludibacillus agaradhaerens]MCR6109232.1 PTS lactose/cellobiose transporter subunit IIA [Bacillus sp. A301a_S52]MCR6097992.1 PTS lactose/cellobiose transporter subunit IIA [Salipaludibacillus agaradhaerens]MCR6105143.1 PTS lactose/cellobiose transporter subunit IIA [Salipaludibacillus agaradhaerens]MCR6116379.1 PTS lactose/cellobiose transporter subunit IIA [Salipaludibacillus agaradhaerens]MCR6117188.1 PTS lactose/cellobiose transporter 
MENLESTIFQLILHGGDGKSLAMEALAEARKGDIPSAKEKIDACVDALNEAHHIQTSLIQKETSGNLTVISLLMVHAQDHLMNAITVKDMAIEMIEIYDKMNQISHYQHDNQ